MTSAKDVSKVILKSSATPISNLKLQKLLYYVQGWSLAMRGKEAFFEDIEAWVHGPVVPVAFYEFRPFGWNPISVPSGPMALPDSEVSHIKAVLKAYGGFTAVQLESLSHDEAPWINARKGCDPKDRCKNVITKSGMKSFFSKKLNA